MTKINDRAVGSGYKFKSDETVVNTADHLYTEWIEFAQEDNSLATATKSAVTNKSHHVKNISGGFSGSVSGAKLSLFDGSTEVGRWYVHNDFQIDLSGVKLTAGKKAEVQLDASGSSGKIGAVVITGVTSRHGAA